MFSAFVKMCGGVHMLGPVWVVIHDRGVMIAWKQVVKWSYVNA